MTVLSQLLGGSFVKVADDADVEKLLPLVRLFMTLNGTPPKAPPTINSSATSRQMSTSAPRAERVKAMLADMAPPAGVQQMDITGAVNGLAARLPNPYLSAAVLGAPLLGGLAGTVGGAIAGPKRIAGAARGAGVGVAGGIGATMGGMAGGAGGAILSGLLGLGASGGKGLTELGMLTGAGAGGYGGYRAGKSLLWDDMGTGEKKTEKRAGKKFELLQNIVSALGGAAMGGYGAYEASGGDLTTAGTGALAGAALFNKRSLGGIHARARAGSAGGGVNRSYVELAGTDLAKSMALKAGITAVPLGYKMLSDTKNVTGNIGSASANINKLTGDFADTSKRISGLVEAIEGRQADGSTLGNRVSTAADKITSVSQQSAKDLAKTTSKVTDVAGSLAGTLKNIEGATAGVAGVGDSLKSLSDTAEKSRQGVADAATWAKDNGTMLAAGGLGLGGLYMLNSYWNSRKQRNRDKVQ